MALPGSKLLLGRRVGEEPAPPEAAAGPHTVLARGGRGGKAREEGQGTVKGQRSSPQTFPHLLGEEPPVPADLGGRAKVPGAQEGHHVEGQEARHHRGEVDPGHWYCLHQQIPTQPAQIVLVLIVGQNSMPLFVPHWGKFA